MDRNRGGNIFVWTLLWVLLVMSTLPPFVNVSTMIIVHQQFVDNAQNAMTAAVKAFPTRPQLARLQLQSRLDQEMPHAVIDVVSFSRSKNSSQAIVVLSMNLPVPVAGWSRWTARVNVTAS